MSQPTPLHKRLHRHADRLYALAEDLLASDDESHAGSLFMDHGTARRIAYELEPPDGEGWGLRAEWARSVECACGYMARELHREGENPVICTKCGNGRKVEAGTALRRAIGAVGDGAPYDYHEPGQELPVCAAYVPDEYGVCVRCGFPRSHHHEDDR